MSRGIPTFELSKSPTLMWRASNVSAALSRSRLRLSDCSFFSPSWNQSMRNSSSTCFRPLSRKMLRISLRLYFSRSEEHTSELQSHSDLHSFPTRRSSDFLLLAVLEPVDEELEFDMLQAVVTEDAAHLLEAVFLQALLEVRVPEAHAGEPRLRQGLGAVAEIEGREFLVRVRQRAAGESPVRPEEFGLGQIRPRLPRRRRQDAERQRRR